MEKNPKVMDVHHTVASITDHNLQALAFVILQSVTVTNILLEESNARGARMEKRASEMAALQIALTNEMREGEQARQVAFDRWQQQMREMYPMGDVDPNERKN